MQHAILSVKFVSSSEFYECEMSKISIENRIFSIKIVLDTIFYRKSLELTSIFYSIIQNAQHRKQQYIIDIEDVIPHIACPEHKSKDSE